MMNTFNSIYKGTATLVMVTMLALAGCDKGSDPSANEAALKILKHKTWQVRSVVVDGVDKSADYAGMTISFTDKTFITVNGGAIWLPQNTWEFANEQATSMMRGDGVEVEIVTLTSAALVVTLSWNETTFAPGRSHALAGAYTFTFE